MGQHLRLDLADQSLNCALIDARRRAQLQKERPPGGEIGVGAFVERTVLIRDAAGTMPQRQAKDWRFR